MSRPVPLPIPSLRALRAAVANSPIVIACAARPTRHFADWCDLHDPVDLDAVILAWIASHVPARTRATLI
jgi:hypothetical protein